MKPKVIFLVGPTAIGKTETALYLAKEIKAEIISCDSMQVYKGMDILTSKPSASVRKKIPHHLVDIVKPEKKYNVSRYRSEALKKIREILRKGRTPLFVGGAGLYMSVVVDGIFKGAKGNNRIREKLYRQAQRHGKAYLYARLKKIDPCAAEKIHPNDTRRIVRALEVYHITGKPISFLQKQRKGLTDSYDVRIVCLTMERARLYEKIDKRVDRMFSRGLVKEVKKLLRMKLSATAAKAIGLREVDDYLAGKLSLDEARNEMKRNTRLYAKRQLTWFRKDKRIRWFEIINEKPKEIAKGIWKKYCL